MMSLIMKLFVYFNRLDEKMQCSDFTRWWRLCFRTHTLLTHKMNKLNTLNSKLNILQYKQTQTNIHRYTDACKQDGVSKRSQ